MIDRKVVLFDLGGVLVESRGRAVLRTLLPGADEREVLDRWQRSPSVDLFERGRISPETFARRFIGEWDLAVAEPEFIELVASWVTGFFDGAASLVRELRTRHTVACLSNTNALHWARLPDAPEWFDLCFASHHTGLLKPEPAAYEHALRALGVAPETVYFFDDLAPNVAAARRAGIRAFQVNGFADLEPILRTERLYD